MNRTKGKTFKILLMYIPLNILIHKYCLSDYKTFFHFIIKFALYIFLYCCVNT